MILIGIVGALSPLGRGIIAKLQESPSEFKVIFTVDDGYAKNDYALTEFKEIEEALLLGLRPELVLDFGDYASTAERAKFYRSEGIPALMQGILSNEDVSIINRYGDLYASAKKCAPIIVEPDFSTVMIQLVKNMLEQTRVLRDSVEKIDVCVHHNASELSVLYPWLCWAEAFNSSLGKRSSPILKGSVAHCGVLNIKSMFNSQMTHVERVNVKLSLSSGYRHHLSWDMVCPILETRIEGVWILLNWYIYKRDFDQSLVLGKVVVSMLPSLI